MLLLLKGKEHSRINIAANDAAFAATICGTLRPIGTEWTSTYVLPVALPRSIVRAAMAQGKELGMGPEGQ